MWTGARVKVTAFFSSPARPPTTMLSSLAFLSFFLLFIPSQAAFSPLVVPLGVKSPYVNVWLPAGQAPSNNWPNFWNLGQVLGWQGYVNVDGIAYSFLGAATGAPTAANVSTFMGMTITPTQTNYVLQAGPMKIDISFLSPIEPDDWVKQSFPFFYMALSVSTTDNASHNVSVYSDISGEWLSYNTKDTFQWETSQTPATICHSLWLQNPQSLTENNGMSEDGVAYFATSLKQPGISWQSGEDIKVRSQFISNGALANTQDMSFRAIEQNWPVFGLAAEFGSTSSSSSPMVWAMGKTRDPAIKYTGNSGSQLRSSYFQSKYNANLSSAIDDFLNDYPNALQRANALDQKILNDAGKISQDYGNLVALAARQTLGATEITIGKDSKGQWNSSDVKIFMREMGNKPVSAVNRVDTLFASLPAFLYLNASMAGKLLEPLHEYQSTSAYTNPYAAANLGTAYPNATGNTAAHPQGVEQSGNMLIMALAHARASGDGGLLSIYYSLFKVWADYLSTNALFPGVGQQTADGIQLGNYTNLAVKGIIGVQAMSEISRAVGKSDDAVLYATSAASMVQQWVTAASTADHLESVYGDPTSGCLIYNLYADKLLGLNLIYDLQTNFYKNEAGSAPNFGLPVDSTHDSKTVMSHWLALTAATASQPDVRDSLLGMIIKRAGSNDKGVDGAFPTTYDANVGGGIDGHASAAQGAMFAQLALNIPNMTISASHLPVNGTSSSKHTNNSSAVVIGGVVAAVVVVLSGVLVALWLISRYHRNPDAMTNPMAASNESILHPFLLLHPRNSEMQVENPSPTSDSYSNAGGSEEARRLQTELELLRIEVQEIRNVRQPPPEYTSQYSASSPSGRASVI